MSGTPHICCISLRLLLFIILLVVSPFFHSGRAQTGLLQGGSLPVGSYTITLKESLRDSLLVLPHQFILAGTDTLHLDSAIILQRGRDYSINYRLGTIRFDSVFVVRMTHAPPALPHEVSFRYAYLPFQFPESYFLRSFTVVRDSSGTDSVKLARPRTGFTLDDIFGPKLQKSGSIVRGFTVGSNRDLSLNSGLRLQLAGRLASDLEVAAALTDENTPIQPEGTTQTLQEFDKVFVEIRSTDVRGTLGDFNLDFSGTEFSRLSRKLQGAKGTADYRTGVTAGTVTISGAITRGKYNTNQFTGLEGVQGPYRLSGRNGEREIIVIAGSERVYINGQQQTRGETNDYTIDYSLGEVTFSPRRLITSASRIVIDFEYTDRQYSRSLFAAQSSSGFFDNKAKFTFTYLREADDPDAPIEATLSDSARQVLQLAGADREKAVLSGITRVDSNGQYTLVDTILAGGQHAQFYRYAPGAPNALYVVTFSSVGPGKGDYVRQQAGVFTWKGPGGGDYLPVKYIPLPQSQQLMDFALVFKPTGDLAVEGEYARSVFDANRLSTVQGTRNPGNAYRFSAAYAPRNLHVGGVDIGGFDLQFKERFVGTRFVPIDRTNDIEFTRKWGIDSLMNADEESQEASLKYLPSSNVTVGTGYGSIKRGEALQSTRTDGMLRIAGTDLPTVDYVIENVRSKDAVADNDGSWLRQNGSAEYRLGKFIPVVRYEGERRDIRSIAGDTLKSGSFSFDAAGGGLGFKDAGPLSASAEFGWRADNVFQNSAVVREATSFTQAYSGKLSEWNNLTSTLDVTLRQKRYAPLFKEIGNQDIKTVLVRSQSRYAPLQRSVDADLYYEVETQRSSKLQRVFVRVAQGSGNYRYLGDSNNNGIADENEFVLTRFDGDFIAITLPTDELFPIIDLKTSIRLRLTPARLITGTAGGPGKILSMLSSETYARIEEKSTERDLKNIYLMHFSHFRNDSTTISGTALFTQDVNVFEGQPAFSSRLRYSEKRGLNNFAGGVERSFGRERSVRLRWQLVPEISNQIDVVNKIDRVTSVQVSSRLRDILSNDVVFDLSYRPEQNVEFGFKVQVTGSTDRYPAVELAANLNAQSLRWVYAFLGAGQARVEVSREEVLLNRPSESYAYELTGGRVPGKTWLWRGAFDYRVTQFIQATVNYDGRAEGGSAPVHTMRAEVRAFF